MKTFSKLQEQEVRKVIDTLVESGYYNKAAGGKFEVNIAEEDMQQDNTEIKDRFKEIEDMVSWDQFQNWVAMVIKEYERQNKKKKSKFNPFKK